MKTIVVLLLSLAVFSASFSVAPAHAEECGGWWNPCCPWWEPEKCPPPINQHKKNVAKAAADYFDNAETFLTYTAIATCAGGLIIPCATAGATAFYANRLSAEQRKIVVDPPDPNYMYPYELYIPSAQEIGGEYTYLDGNADNLIYHTTVLAGYGDFIYNSSNRVTSCQQAGDDCKYWQQARVDEGLRQFGAWAYNTGYLLENIAARVEEESGGDPLFRDLIWYLRDMARVVFWAGSEYWQ